MTHSIIPQDMKCIADLAANQKFIDIRRLHLQARLTA